MCLSLHTEVLSFEDSEWSHGRSKMECHVEKLKHFRHILFFLGLSHSFLFLMLAYRHNFSSLVMIQDRYGRCCSWANRWQASRDAHLATRWVLWFWLRACGTNILHPIFEPCPLNTNVARWWNGHSSSYLQFSSTLTWIIVDYCVQTIFIKPRSSSSTWSVTNIKTILLKARKPFSCRSVSDGIVPVHGANVSYGLCCFRPTFELKENNCNDHSWGCLPQSETKRRGKGILRIGDAVTSKEENTDSQYFNMPMNHSI